jgi:hypothetical protein
MDHNVDDIIITSDQYIEIKKDNYKIRKLITDENSDSESNSENTNESMKMNLEDINSLDREIRDNHYENQFTSKPWWKIW